MTLITHPHVDTNLAEFSDATLLKLHAHGHHRAFRVLLERHRRLMWSAVRQAGITCEEEGSDVLQDALLKVHRYATRWEGDAKVGTWIFTVVRNTALTHVRARNRRINPEAVDFEERMRTFATDCRHEESTIDRVDLHAYLGKLTAELREVMILTALHGLSEAEVGEKLGIPRGTVKSRKARARRMLREMLTVTVDG
ncbi:RNA polymerase sigma factor [Corynebacterium anserum]|nr:sigma-70 family RNA polymerase sigma factor [Corynebacterium anserum]